MALLDLPIGTGSPADLVDRLGRVLPGGWFADQAPVLDTVLNALAAGWSGLFQLLTTTQAQTRIATASSIFLDMTSQDFLGATLPRRTAEPDDSYRIRIERAILRTHNTRADVLNAILSVTNRPPRLIEPARIADTGSWNGRTNFAYGAAGAWGTRNLPFQFMVNAYRPVGTGIAHCFGYGTPAAGYGVGAAQYATPSIIASQVLDADIYAAIAAVLPAATTAWVAISN